MQPTRHIPGGDHNRSVIHLSQSPGPGCACVLFETGGVERLGQDSVWLLHWPTSGTSAPSFVSYSECVCFVLFCFRSSCCCSCCCECVCVGGGGGGGWGGRCFVLLVGAGQSLSDDVQFRPVVELLWMCDLSWGYPVRQISKNLQIFLLQRLHCFHLCIAYYTLPSCIVRASGTRNTLRGMGCVPSFTKVSRSV